MEDLNDEEIQCDFDFQYFEDEIILEDRKKEPEPILLEIKH